MAGPLVLLHGFTQTGATWQPVVEALGGEREVVTPDIRGHGSAAGRRPVGFEECVADVVDGAPQRLSLAGYSMGGRLALAVALAHPHRVERLVLISATAGIADPVEREARREADEALASELEEMSIEHFARRWAAQPLLRRQPPEVAAAAHEDRLRNTPGGLAAALRGIGTGAMEPLWARLGDLRMPVTLVAGERDGKFRKLAERIAASVSDPTLVIVPAVGHAVHLEAPRLVAACLTEASGARLG